MRHARLLDKGLLVLLVVGGFLSACGIPSSPERTPAASSTGGATGPLAGPTQSLPPPSRPSPTAVPTLSVDMQWIEPEATKGVVLEVPNEVSGGQDVYLISPDGSPPMLLTNLRGTELASAAGAPDGKWLAIETADLARNHEFFREKLSLLSLTTLDEKPIVEETSIISYAWSPTGDMLAYTELLPEGAGGRIVVFDPGTGGHRVLFESVPPGGWQVLGWALEGKSLLIGHFLGNGLLHDKVALVDVFTGSLTRVYSDPDKTTSTAIPAPNGQAAIVLKQSPSNFIESAMFVLDLASGGLTPWIERDTPGLFIVSLPLWSPDGQRVALTVSDQSQSQKQGEATSTPLRIIVIDLTGLKSEVVRIETPPMLVRPLAWASDNVLVVNNLGGETLDQVVYSVRVDGSQAQKVAWGRFLTTIPINR